MTDKKDLSNNPFAALLTSGGDDTFNLPLSKDEQEAAAAEPGKHLEGQFYVCLVTVRL